MGFRELVYGIVSAGFFATETVGSSISIEANTIQRDVFTFRHLGHSKSSLDYLSPKELAEFIRQLEFEQATEDFTRLRNGILEEKGYEILDAEYDEMLPEGTSEKME
ncbi:hypothetical protein N0V88_007609 [Collariella sp. IMI 366227]|nr:hypothetical protein N0V88_007609 [Collariella sp. IMI 366227]